MMATPEQLLQFIHTSPSPFHCVLTAKALLKAHGFTELSLHTPWQVTPGQSYYVNIFDSTLIAFSIGQHAATHLRIAAAHTDFPCLKVKPNAGIQEQGYGKLNTELYGGMIRESWLDRPLSMAGKVVLRGADAFHPDVRFIDIGRPILTIPRLAIHMNRHVNNGVALNPQKDMLPLMTMAGDASYTTFLPQLLGTTCQCSLDDILSYELTVYPTEEGCLMGLHNEFISSPRLDNQTSVFACVDGLVSAQEAEGINVIAIFDNEEVGSRTKQGAASLVLPHILQRLYRALGQSAEDYDEALASAFLLSIDVAHALHPNVPEKCDPTNKPLLGKGVALKTASSQSYAGDADAVAIIKTLCQDNSIPYQQFVNRADMPGGSTIGSLLSANLPIRTMDIGIPILAMHSARELMGTADQDSLNRLVNVFFMA